MPKIKDYLPSDESKLIQWSTDFFGYLNPHAVSWNVDSAKLTEVETFSNSFSSAYQLYHQPEHHTPMNRQAKDKAKKTYVKDLRVFNQAYLIHNPLVSDADRVALGLHVPKPGPSPIPGPLTYPVIKRFVSIGAGWLEMHFQDVTEEKSKAKPSGVHGAEIKWGLYASGTSLPVTAEALPDSAFATRTPYRFELPGSAHGMTLCAVLRWENSRGVKGPWSPHIESTVVE
jgi:hypothetical protein